MTQRQYGIGDHCTFRDRGITREGRVVASEIVTAGDRDGRRPGRHLTLRIAGTLFEDVEVPESALGSILDAVA